VQARAKREIKEGNGKEAREGKKKGKREEVKVEEHTLAKPPAKPNPIPPNKPGAAKNASPLPIVPSIVPPNNAATPPTAAYFAYRIKRRMMYRRTYLISALPCFGAQSRLSSR